MELNNAEITITLETKGMDELKKLLTLAIKQVEQLENTLTQINEIKIRVV